jgi:hypothetical protein
MSIPPKTTVAPAVESLLEQWAASPTTHPRVGDWRRAGYRRGAPLPRRVEGPTIDAGARGIVAGEHDVSAALQQLLDELEASGGVLQLGPGRYTLNEPLLIHGSNVVLRGAGTSETTLYFPRTLGDSFGPALFRESTAWSWTGGHIYFVSRDRLERSRDADWGGFEGWIVGDKLAKLSAAERGTYVVTVDGADRITPGAIVLLEVPDDDEHTVLQEMAGGIPGAAEYDWETRAATIAGTDRYPDFDAYRWPVRVVAVDGPRITLEQPLKIGIPVGATAWSIGPTVHDSGVESLTIENKVVPQTTHNINPGSNGVCFHAVHDCWARDVRVLNADLAFGFTAAKSCQLTGISAGGRSLHHFVACRVQSHDNLIEDFRLDEFTVSAVAGSYLHGLNVEGFSSGNVYRRGVLHTGTFDSHRQLPFENLRTAITVTNKDAVPGGARNAGPYFGARSVNWGIDVTNGNNLCMDITDMAPRSLTAGITGLDQRGSILPRGGPDFDGPLDSETIAFGDDLGPLRDLLEVQRDVAPIA